MPTFCLSAADIVDYDPILHQEVGSSIKVTNSTFGHERHTISRRCVMGRQLPCSSLIPLQTPGLRKVAHVCRKPILTWLRHNSLVQAGFTALRFTSHTAGLAYARWAPGVSARTVHRTPSKLQRRRVPTTRLNGT